MPKDNTWQLQEAKAKFSEFIRESNNAPQFVTVRGERVSVMLSLESYNKLKGRKPTFLELIDSSPLNDVELDLERDKSLPRDIEL